MEFKIDISLDNDYFFFYDKVYEDWQRNFPKSTPPSHTDAVELFCSTEVDIICWILENSKTASICWPNVISITRNIFRKEPLYVHVNITDVNEAMMFKLLWNDNLVD